MEKNKLTRKEVKDLYCICDDLEHELGGDEEGPVKVELKFRIIRP